MQSVTTILKNPQVKRERLSLQQLLTYQNLERVEVPIFIEDEKELQELIKSPLIKTLKVATFKIYYLWNDSKSRVEEIFQDILSFLRASLSHSQDIHFTFILSRKMHLIYSPGSVDGHALCFEPSRFNALQELWPIERVTIRDFYAKGYNSQDVKEVIIYPKDEEYFWYFDGDTDYPCFNIDRLMAAFPNMETLSMRRYVRETYRYNWPKKGVPYALQGENKNYIFYTIHPWLLETLEGSRQSPWIRVHPSSRFNKEEGKTYPNINHVNIIACVKYLSWMKRIFPNFDWPILEPPSEYEWEFGYKHEEYLAALEEVTSLFTGFRLHPLFLDRYPQGIEKAYNVKVASNLDYLSLRP